MNKKIEELKEQIEYLKKYSRFPFHAHENENSFEHLVQLKFELMKLIKASSIIENQNIVTNIKMNPYPDKFPFSKIHSLYEGQDFKVEELLPNNFLYQSPASHFYFLKSGQAAVNVLWLYLFETLSNIQILNPSHIYHESKAFFDYMKKRVSGAEQPIVYVDSLSWGLHKKEEFCSHLNDAKYVIIDSTCWEMNSVEMNFLLEATKNCSYPCFVVRSHVKLDSLGAEYGLLGSLFIYQNKADADWDAINTRLNKITAIMRYAASYNDLYPFWDKNIFKKLVSNRVQGIKANTKWVADTIEREFKDDVIVERFPHDLYCYLKVKKPSTRRNLLKVIEMGQSGLKFADSFGFDFMSLTFVSTEEQNIWRLCGSNLDQVDLEKNTDLIIDVIRKTK